MQAPILQSSRAAPGPTRARSGDQGGVRRAHRRVQERGEPRVRPTRPDANILHVDFNRPENEDLREYRAPPFARSKRRRHAF